MTTTRSNPGSVVLTVGGWSPGPLVYLRPLLTARQCVIVEPRNLPMPPFPGSWCCHPKVLVMFGVTGILLWLACARHTTIAWNIIAILAALVSLRLLAAVVVRTSIQVSAQSCLETTRQFDGNVILIGFSWGGAVIAELLAQGKFGDRPRALLIAPTTSLVASIAYQKDPAFQMDCATNAAVHVVHGTEDLAFCPNQTRWTGDNVHRIRDNHVFFRQSSQRLLMELVTRLLGEASEGRAE